MWASGRDVGPTKDSNSPGPLGPIGRSNPTVESRPPDLSGSRLFPPPATDRRRVFCSSLLSSTEGFDFRNTCHVLRVRYPSLPLFNLHSSAN